jgi:copper oxidase (laccase) domain-containing protein
VPDARTSTRAGTAGLDLRAGLRAQLTAAGVTALDISVVCTAEDPSYFSYRRDGVTGRFAGVAMIDP